MSRPRPYTIVAVLMVLYCLIDLSTTIPTLAQGMPAPTADAPPFFMTLASFALDILGLVAVYGIWHMQKWGVVLTITVAALNILGQLPAIAFAPMPMRILSVIGLVWSAAMIVLLLQPTRQRIAA